MEEDVDIQNVCRVPEGDNRQREVKTIFKAKLKNMNW